MPAHNTVSMHAAEQFTKNIAPASMSLGFLHLYTNIPGVFVDDKFAEHAEVLERPGQGQLLDVAVDAGGQSVSDDNATHITERQKRVEQGGDPGGNLVVTAAHRQLVYLGCKLSLNQRLVPCFEEEPPGHELLAVWNYHLRILQDRLGK